MTQFIGCDAHRRYSVFATVDEDGKLGPSIRVEHEPEQFRKFLRGLEPGSQVAVEASGGWYWLMSELEAAGLEGHLANPQEAKQRMRGRNKTDALGVCGSGKLHGDAWLEIWRAARRSPVSQAATRQGACQGRSGGGSPLGRIQLVDTTQIARVS